jgi:hypothetical protein
MIYRLFLTPHLVSYIYPIEAVDSDSTLFALPTRGEASSSEVEGFSLVPEAYPKAVGSEL